MHLSRQKGVQCSPSFSYRDLMMSDTNSGRLLTYSAIISTVIAGLFALLTKSVPEGGLRALIPYAGGKVVQSAPMPVCQLIRFWVPQKIPATPSSRPIEQITEDLNMAVTNKFGGWTRWQVDGEWKDPQTTKLFKERGYMYEVGLQSCNEADVKTLYDIVSRFVKQDMSQAEIYFAATKFSNSQ